MKIFKKNIFLRQNLQNERKSKMMTMTLDELDSFFSIIDAATSKVIKLNDVVTILIKNLCRYT